MISYFDWMVGISSKVFPRLFWFIALTMKVILSCFGCEMFYSSKGRYHSHHLFLQLSATRRPLPPSNSLNLPPAHIIMYLLSTSRRNTCSWSSVLLSKVATCTVQERERELREDTERGRIHSHSYWYSRLRAYFLSWGSTYYFILVKHRRICLSVFQEESSIL